MFLQMAVSFFYKAEEYFIVLYHIFFIHLFADGHFGCFHTLAIVDDPVMIRGVQTSPRDSDFVSFGYILRTGMAESYSSSIFKISRNLPNVFLSDRANLIPTNSIQGFPFLHIVTSTCVISCHFVNKHLNRYEVISHYAFNLHFPDA